MSAATIVEIVVCVGTILGALIVCLVALHRDTRAAVKTLDALEPSTVQVLAPTRAPARPAASELHAVEVRNAIAKRRAANKRARAARRTHRRAA